MGKKQTIFMEYPDVMNPRQVQEALHIGRTWTYRLLQKGEIPSFRVGNTYKIPKKKLIKYLKSMGKIED